MKKAPILLFALILLGASCSAHQQITKGDSTERSVKYSPQDIIGVMIANDGIHYFESFEKTDTSTGSYTVSTNQKKIYVGSGSTLSTKVRSALLTRFDSVSLIETLNLDKAIQLCRTGRIAFLVAPRIIHWEDRNTPWSGMPDRIEIEISVYDVTDKTLIDRMGYKANGEYWVLTDYPPEELLNGDFQNALIEFFPLRQK